MIMKVESTIIDIRKVDTSESICDRQEEIRILRDHAHIIATTLAHNSVIVDLGSASLDKVLLLLEALEAQQKPVRYYALDLSATELATALASLPTARFRYVRCAALHGTFDDGLRWLCETPNIRDQVHHLLLLGLTLGNYSRANAAAFLRQLTNQALSTRQAESSILVTLDDCKVPTRVLRAYTSEGVVPFALASLDYANRLLVGQGEGEEKGATQAFDPKDWNYLSEWNYVLGRHEASLIPQAGDVSLGPPLGGITVRREEKVRSGGAGDVVGRGGGRHGQCMVQPGLRGTLLPIEDEEPGRVVVLGLSCVIIFSFNEPLKTR
ncbi:Methyltransferase domain of unknown function DUF2260 [Penicillium expansum]|nr:Methyltransferase domain of unknown function DUF2260 [Penicillium expansum]